MRIIKIDPYDNGAHANQQINGTIVPPDGWAIIPENIKIPDTFPFVDLEEENGIITSLVPGIVPESEPEPVQDQPDVMDDVDTMLIDHEYRLTLLELGITQEV